jgi:hypothetical protein
LAADQEDLARASVLLWPALAAGAPAVMAGAVVVGISAADQEDLARASVLWPALAQAVPAVQEVRQGGQVAVVFKATAQTKKPT